LGIAPRPGREIGVGRQSLPESASRVITSPGVRLQDRELKPRLGELGRFVGRGSSAGRAAEDESAAAAAAQVQR